MKKSILVALFAMGGALFAQEQGQSLAQKLDLVKQKTDKFNAYMNFHSSFDAVKERGVDDLQTKFRTNEFRLEFKGKLNDKLSYRFRQRLWKSSQAEGFENISKATDYMYINYKVTDKFNLTMGKIAQAWGGWEFALTPFNVYEYSDFLYAVGDVFLMGVNFGYQLTPDHELNFTVTNNTNDGRYETNNTPLSYTINWNGNLFDGMLQTRWGFVYQTLEKSKASKIISLGNMVNLDDFHLALDYYRANQDIDVFGYATQGANNQDAVYNTFVAKAEYRVDEKWNIFAKYMNETADVKNADKTIKSQGYFAGLEYYPVKTEDLKFYLVYVGRTGDDRPALGRGENTRISLGMMYRINMF